jgi:hypothetical protein
MAILDEFCADGVAHHARAEYSDFHDFGFLCLSPINLRFGESIICPVFSIHTARHPLYV